MQVNPWNDLGDPTGPVRVQSERQSVDHGILLQRLKFLSHDIDGAPLWVCALYGRPASCPEPVPGLLHIHGGHQTVSIEEVRYFAARGYAVLSFDWLGPTRTRSEKFTTVFPEHIPDIRNRNVPPEHARVRHVTWAARRALTFLQQQPEVDAARLGVYGISWGGLITWLVNGTDDRVQAAIPLYGCGVHDPLNDHREWDERYQPARYAGTQHGDVLHLNGSNDFFGRWENLESFWDDMPETIEKRLAFSPNEDHGIENKLKITAHRWFDWKLKNSKPLPKAPELELELEDGGLWCEVFAPDAAQIRIYYAVTADGTRPNTYWYSGPWGPAHKDFFSAKWRLPIGSRRASIYAEANYEDGTSLSTLPQDLFEKVGTIALDSVDESIWYHPQMGKIPFYTRWTFRGGGLVPGKGFMRARKSLADGRLCLVQDHYDGKNGFEAILRRPACPVVGRGEGQVLALECYCPTAATLTLTGSAATGHRSFDEQKLGSLSLKIQADSKWQTIKIKPSDWKSFNFRQLRQLMIQLQSEISSPVEIGRIFTE